MSLERKKKTRKEEANQATSRRPAEFHQVKITDLEIVDLQTGHPPSAGQKRKRARSATNFLNIFLREQRQFLFEFFHAR